MDLLRQGGGEGEGRQSEENITQLIPLRPHSRAELNFGKIEKYLYLSEGPLNPIDSFDSQYII